MDTHTTSPNRAVLVIGASRGLGEAIVEEYVARGSRVVGTVRGDAPTPLHAFAERAGGAVEIEHVDITKRDEVDALSRRLSGRTFDLLFVVAGIALVPRSAIAADILDDEFERMMYTNVLSVIRTVEALDDLVAPDGTIAVMSSGQGSVANNRTGGFEVYRASKAALNQLMRSYAARHDGEDRALLLTAPGWVQTDMGGSGATLRIEESIPPLVDTVDAQRGAAGLQYLDRNGETVPW
ncbi:SDR family NAD(P)-dependent oxidoreductase [Leifsonia sp. PS1209]|uniref:SDR family NAD(P)-dependent oxidoreductase n=1 Tax=Leifsonia sp. PS1209 TaxID=2724914 RepID=UPI001442D89C|nr:SDR family NAD(P)-dependent oxidoreductase [Leifsonia sp. PS1209]QIZ99907.1 SDR family NAD(P)-dependent oxidoreductase [Leifsonia sp. PS1209]